MPSTAASVHVKRRHWWGPGGGVPTARLAERRVPPPLPGPAGVSQLMSDTRFGWLASLVPAEFDEHRVAGRSLSLERAADLALRVLDEELALAATQRDGGSEGVTEASPTPMATPSDGAGVFRREGDVWTVTWAGATVRLRDARGFAYLAVLLRHPDRELHATDIVRLAGGDEVGNGPGPRPDRELATNPDLGHAGPILDARAHAAYRARLAELREELAEAEGRNDLGRVEHYARRWRRWCSSSPEPSGSHRRRAWRTRARGGDKGLKGALERIAASHPELGRHLTATVRRGYFCVYPSRPRAARALGRVSRLASEHLAQTTHLMAKEVGEPHTAVLVTVMPGLSRQPFQERRPAVGSRTTFARSGVT